MKASQVKGFDIIEIAETFEFINVEKVEKSDNGVTLYGNHGQVRKIPMDAEVVKHDEQHIFSSEMVTA